MPCISKKSSFLGREAQTGGKITGQKKRKIFKKNRRKRKSYRKTLLQPTKNIQGDAQPKLKNKGPTTRAENHPKVEKKF